jgi:hypothetical protein
MTQISPATLWDFVASFPEICDGIEMATHVRTEVRGLKFESPHLQYFFIQ